MAGGTCTDKRGISDNLRERKEWSHHNYCHREFSSKLVNNNQPSDYFNGRKISEFKRTYTKNISLLQKNILRIFTGCHHSDLYIIHGTNVLQTNCCIFKTRSPTLYNVLEKFFANGVKPIKCYLNTAQVFHRIESFVRLLYINFDISKEEQALLAILLSKKSSIELEARNSENDLSSSSSEMADSGLETGSLSINETTESENSGTDIEESHVTDYISTDDDFMRVSSSCDGEKLNGKKKIKEGEKEKNCWSEGRDTISSDGNACGSSFSMARQLNEKYKTRNNGVEEEEEDETTIDDVSRYENEVLNDIFYESDGGNDNEQSGSFIQTGSFEFIEPESLPSTTTPIQTTATSSKKIKTPSVEVFDQFPSLLDEKVATNSSTKSLIVESTHHELSHSNDNSLNKSSSSVNNYYFIDASSLNDETEIITTTGASLPIYLDSVSYIPSRSNNLNDQLNKPNSHSSSGHEKIAEFQRELKLTETLEPVTEQRKVKRVDSLTDDKSNEKQIEKESLVVEIKEVDSGESNHPSPCIDNNKPASKFENDMSIISEMSNDSRRSSLIRGNTFELKPGDEKLSHLRQEQERRQGTLVFNNSIPQYSGHRVDGDSISDGSNNFSSISYFPIEATSLSTDRFKYKKSRNTGGFLSFDGSNSLTKIDDANGIYSMTKSASDKLLADYSETDDSSIGDCMSLPMTFNDNLQRGGRICTIKKTKHDETTPILSGGVCTTDYSKPIDSPIVRRKTETTPIVSGGSVIMELPQEKIKTPPKMSSSMTAAWVVDMSDCTKLTNQKSNPASPNMSKSFSTYDAKNRTKTPDKPNSLGFFINFNDIDNPRASKTTSVQSLKKDGNKKQSFFVDISGETRVKKNQETVNSAGKLQDKKNIFSMFIDLNDSQCVKSGNREIKSMSCLQQGQRGGIDDSGNSSSNGKSDSSGELRSSDKKGVFMFIESDSPVVRRRTLSTSRPAFKRHSWNMEKCQQQISPNPNSNTSNGNIQKEITSFRREHKRAHSVSIDPVMQLKLSAKKSESSASLNQIGKSCSLNIPETAQETSSSHPEALNFDQFDYEIRDTPPNSHVELVNDDLRGRVKEQEYKELVRSDMFSSTETKTLDDDRSDVSMWEKTATESIDGHTRKSETFNISSGTASGPSPESDNNDFDLAEYHNELLHVDNQQQKNPPKLSETHKSLTETIKKIECEFEDGFKNDDTKLDTTKSDTKENEESKASCSGFVRLSDLDKTPATKIVTEEINDNTRITNISYRMSKSIPETSWVESKLAINRVSGPCQVRTLSSRKFSTIMSTSLPAKNKSPTDELLASGFGGSEMPSESDLSSMQSSMGRSGVDVSTEETETSSFIATKPYNRLGEDLLRMFLEEINPDVTIDVGGRRIRAHKCILSSRCQYFAAILSGGWIESAGNVISLQGYSYSSVHFALCHIYSGDSNIPDSISIVELATLADMLCLEGLKEVIGYTLKVKYCHLFHKPCQICTVGVLECMPLAAAYGLDEVYRKSLRWITRHFVRIWPCKAFSALPRELMDKCYQQHIVHMSADNVLQTIMDCDKLLATLPNVRWAEPVFRMVSNLLEIGLKFLSDNFSNVLSNDSFHALGRDLTWNISRLEDNVLSAADKLPPDQACKSYSKLYKMLATIPPEDSIIKPQWSLLFIEFLKKIQGRVEKCLIKDAARAARTTTWLKMDLELRRRIQELACLVILPHEQLKRPTRHSNFMKDLKTPPSRTSASRSLDLRRVKRTITDQVEKTFVKSGIPQANKNLMSTKPKTDPLERKMQGVKVGMTSEVNYIRPKSWPNKLEVKSRYLEPRNKSIPKDNVPERTITAQQRRKNLISSSDSSRTSSPAMKRAADKKPISKLKLSVKKDVKALSTDSLTDASTSLKSRKKETSKSCGITRAESRAESPSLKTKDIGISADSLAETKKKPAVTKKPSKMDNSMSTDSLTTELTVTPKTNIGNKKSPTLGRSTIKSQALERAKKSSPPMNQRSPLSITKRPVRSVENSTAASRNRAAATTTIYHGSPNLRRNLLDAAKTPDLPQSKITNGTSSSSRINSRQSTPSTSTPPAIKKDKKDINNPVRSDSPNKRSPKLNNGINRPSRPTNVAKKTYKGIEDKFKTKCNDSLKQPTVGSRSGTFLKDEPTILKKSDMKKNQVTT